ncbi:conjugal transfer protein TraH [Amycolatopsis sp. CA-126428]|uniref:conjugal transfer protein TraH n=1 Tax=Amycolatopsis sp. CA-126428 TaxID=2073158 RepID=UPI000CD2DFA3|nr:conjugal transfer protein TraH [Amycolatopsis sp. CA-126428]
MSRDERCRTRTDAAVAWTTAHAAELAGVGVPLIGGAVFTPWLDLVSVAWAALWAANEFRLRRTTRTARQVAVATRPARPALSTSTDDEGERPPAEAGSRKEVSR